MQQKDAMVYSGKLCIVSLCRKEVILLRQAQVADNLKHQKIVQTSILENHAILICLNWNINSSTTRTGPFTISCHRQFTRSRSKHVDSRTEDSMRYTNPQN